MWTLTIFNYNDQTEERDNLSNKSQIQIQNKASEKQI